MSVRKRKWTTRSGEAKEAWIVDYTDQQGDRHIKTFARKKDADAYSQQVGVDVRAGRIRRSQSRSPWRRPRRTGSSRSSWRGARPRHWRNIASTRATSTSASAISSSPASPHRASMVSATTYWRRCRARCRARSCPASSRCCATRSAGATSPRTSPWRQADQRRQAPRGQAQGRRRYPDPERSRRSSLLQGRSRPLLLTAIFTGLRASELRGLRWSDVDLKDGELHVRQRADRYNEMG